jgi:Yip1 domain
MASDPTQGQEQPGNGEQGQPANGGPEPNPGYSAPQNPYEGQRQPASGAEPYSGYGTPQNPYGTPPQNPYATPPQNPYTSPPPQNPYATPQQYSTPPYQQGGYGYGYAPPHPAPRSIGQAIQELPYQYYRVLTKPSVRTFAEEMGKADWAMVWIQLGIWVLVGTIIGFIRSAIGLAGSSFVTNNTFNPASITALTVGGSIFSIIAVPVSFFIVVGIQYLLAKAFQGEGNFLTQGYTYLLFEVPIYIVSYLLGLIPIFGAIAGFALAIYGIVLNVFSIMAVHRLSGGKASGVVLIPIAVLILLVFLCAFIIAAIIIAATRTTTP